MRCRPSVHSFKRAVFFALVCVLATGLAAANPVKPVSPALLKGDAMAGKIKAESERCLECHDSAGPGLGLSRGQHDDNKFARLGGQNRHYIVKQIQDFRSGARKYDFMQMMARSISDADLADIAAYFASAPAMPGNRAPMMPGTGTQNHRQGRNLYVNGDPGRQIVACITCHGAAGQGLTGADNGASPVIGGQTLRYLEKQLFDWRSGERSNSAGNTMNAATKALTDADILALAHYISEL